MLLYKQLSVRIAFLMAVTPSAAPGGTSPPGQSPGQMEQHYKWLQSQIAQLQVQACLLYSLFGLGRGLFIFYRYIYSLGSRAGMMQSRVGLECKWFLTLYEQSK